MEILFKDKSNARPVYDFQIKQEWEKHVSYQCPAQVTPAELKAIERVCRETFAALDCRDVARVDLRMTAKGDIYVIEVNPLPGLTPGYSDLCLIAQAAGIEYRNLIGEILEGGLKRLREKRREAKAENKQEAKTEPRPSGNGTGTAANGNGTANGNGAPGADKTPGPADTNSDDGSGPHPE
jgi:D-alanine-D-alanine ligase